MRGPKRGLMSIPMSELAWDDTDVTVVKPKSATVEPPDLPTLPPPGLDAPDMAKTEVRDGDGPDMAKTEVRAESAPTAVSSSTRPKSPLPEAPLRETPPRPASPLAPDPKPLSEAKIGILPPRRFVSQLAITEVEGDERDTWTFLRSTVAIPMIKATQALPLVRVRRRRLINALPWVAMLVGAISGVVLCWWLTLPKTAPIAASLAPARATIARSVAGLFVDGPGARASPCIVPLPTPAGGRPWDRRPGRATPVWPLPPTPPARSQSGYRDCWPVCPAAHREYDRHPVAPPG